MGLHHSDLAGADVLLHSLVFDARLLDYKFFGYVVLPLSRAQVAQAWETAPDKSENVSLHFIDVSDSQKAAGLVRGMVASSAEWAPEALYSTTRALLHAGRLSRKDIESALAGTSTSSTVSLGDA